MSLATSKADLQEQEYRLPIHWLLRKAGLKIYLFKTDVMASMIKSDLPLHDGKFSALDLGCGDGRGTYEISSRLQHFEFTGIDFSERAIAFAKLMAPGLKFVVQNANHIESADSAYDLVVAREVIEHILPEEIPLFLSEIRRVLAPKGKLLITTPSVNRLVPPKHFQHFTEESLKVLLDSAGFRVIDVVGIGLWPPQRVEKPFRFIISLPMLWRIHAYLGTRLPPTKYAENLLVFAECKG